MSSRAQLAVRFPAHPKPTTEEQCRADYPFPDGLPLP
jgi:hypothetical protein